MGICQVPSVFGDLFLAFDACPLCNQDVCNIRLLHKKPQFLPFPTLLEKEGFFNHVLEPFVFFLSSRNDNIRKQITPLRIKLIPGGLSLKGHLKLPGPKVTTVGQPPRGSVGAAVLRGWQELHFISKNGTWQQSRECPQYC